MRYGLTFGAVCVATTCFLAGSGESSAQDAGPAPATAIAPFDATQAKVHQQAWADHLGVPVETTNSVGMKFVVIPPGEFTMGSPASELGRRNKETQHTVTLTVPFLIGVHEVTQSQYQHVFGSNPSLFRGPDFPVQRVSWTNAIAFCRKLSALPAEQAAGRVYRLPTEAEWEYACRAGTTTQFRFGDDESQLGEYAWSDENGEETTHAVGQKLSNAWGLYDIHGNVWEWCFDWDSPYPTIAVADPQGPAKGSYRVFRGGCWSGAASGCRTAIRGANAPTYCGSGIGFRIALGSQSVKSPEAEQAK